VGNEFVLSLLASESSLQIGGGERVHVVVDIMLADESGARVGVGNIVMGIVGNIMMLSSEQGLDEGRHVGHVVDEIKHLGRLGVCVFAGNGHLEEVCREYLRIRGSNLG
jgi:hypothetical protein